MSNQDNTYFLDQTIADIEQSFSIKPDTSASDQQESPLAQACRYLFKKIYNSYPNDLVAPDDNRDIYITNLASSAGLRVREVKLPDHWWQHDNGPLLLSDNNGIDYYVATPNKQGGYDCYFPEKAISKRVSADWADSITNSAYMFYKALPDQKLNIKDLLKNALSGRYQDLQYIVILQCIISVVMLLSPIAMGWIFDQVIPNADRRLLFDLVCALTVAVLASTCFNIVQTICLIRLRLKLNVSIQSAVWDRLLRLPLNFIKQFSAGDLTNRASGIDTIQQELTAATMSTAISGLLSILTLFVMAYYSWQLTIIACIGIAIIIVTTLVANLIYYKYQKHICNLEGQLEGVILQLLGGIAKLRVSHVENKAFTKWMGIFSKKVRYEYIGGYCLFSFSIFHTFLLILLSMIIYGFIAKHGVQISLGQYIAFNAAFGYFFSSLLGIVGVVNRLISIIPLYQRIKPILITEPESDNNLTCLSSLSGKIELVNVDFRYIENGPGIFKQFSLLIEPGEFVAIVGSSGAGKSTLLRLLLGFEKPSQGHVYYDNHDMRNLNMNMLRAQFGVVLQNASVMQGTLLENIIGSKAASEEEAWAAAAIVGLAEYIKNLPMGMETIVSEGSKTLSGGQRQLLFLARSIVHRPRILYLDEATSALDNIHQYVVHKNLEQLKMTRVVVAHRLSTVRHAHRIIVLGDGGILEQGSFDELIQNQGLFYQLAKRQLLV